MAQYISKDILIEKIDALLDDEFRCNSYDEATGFQNALTLIREFLDTIEVGVVDLVEVELNTWRHNHFHGRRDIEASGEYLKRNTQLELAKHFFELGLKLQEESKQ